MSYQCPLCHLPLHTHNNGWQCDNRHQFDCAKEGYVNLLPVQHKTSKIPGDSAEMMQARRAFLDHDHYRPMRDKVLEKIVTHLPSDANALLDIGCGEGYYTHAFTQATKTIPNLRIHGLDIAKVAIRYAAKRYQSCQFCVASSHRLPFADHSLNGIVRIYAPCKAEELQRVTTEDGILITVTPAPRHLYQMKALIYPQVHLHPENDEQIEGFTRISQDLLHYTMKLSGEDATALMQMTPFAWKTKPETWEELAKSQQFECEAHFCISVHERNKNA